MTTAKWAFLTLACCAILSGRALAADSPPAKIKEVQRLEDTVARRDGGSAEWSSDIRDRGVVYTFPAGWVNTKVHPYAWHPSVVYNEPLGVYMMANWGMGCTPDRTWFGKPSYLGFWSAPHPWGPWSQVYEEKEWTPAGEQVARAYQPQIVPKGIAADGKSFWLVWTDFQFDGPKRPYYSFNLQKVELETE